MVFPVSLSKPASPLRGPLLLIISAVAFSTAGFFTHRIATNLWALVFWRNIFGCLALLPVLWVNTRGRACAGPRPGWRTAAVIAASSFGTICYLAAFSFTSVANISIIYAAVPVCTASLAWLTLGETIPLRTVAATGVALLGVGITVRGSLTSGTVFGDSLALLMVLALSLMAVLARGRPQAPLPTAFGSALLAAVVVLPLGWSAGDGFLISGTDAMWLAAFGLVSMAVALPCYLAGAADVPAGRAMLISALEMPLAPLWVWLAFGAVPATASLVGGGFVAVAVFTDLVAGCQRS